MPSLPIGRLRQWAIGAACIASLAACGAADQPVAPNPTPAEIVAPAPHVATAVGIPTSAAAEVTIAVSTAAPAALVEPTTAPASKETAMPDQPTPQPSATAGPTPRAAASLVPAGAAPDQPAPVPANSAVVAPPFGPELTAMVDTSKADLGQRLALPVDQVELVEMWTVVWPDKGLGCPRSGMEYLQVPVDGLLIRLRAGGQIYDYHGDGLKPPFLCEQKLRVAPAAPAPAINP